MITYALNYSLFRIKNGTIIVIINFINNQPILLKMNISNRISMRFSEIDLFSHKRQIPSISYIIFFFIILSTTSISVIGQGGTCSTSMLLCDPMGNSDLNTSEPSLGSVGCLGSTPNPSFFTFFVSESGNIAMDLAATPAMDIDFAIWGPFASPDGNCGVNFPTGPIVDCSFAGGTGPESVNVNGVNAGEFYIMLVTNFSGGAGTLNLTPQGGNTATLGGPLAFGTNGPFEVFDPAVILDVMPPVSDPNITDVNFSGPGIINTMTGFFSPGFAGPGSHEIRLQATSYGCEIEEISTMISVCNLVVSCNDLTVTLDNNCNYTLYAADVDDGSSDVGCGPVQNLMLTYEGTTASSISFDEDDIGTQMVTLTVENQDGITKSCVATINVEQPCPNGGDFSFTVNGSVPNSIPVVFCDNISSVSLAVTTPGCFPNDGTFTSNNPDPMIPNNSGLENHGGNTATFNPMTSGLGNHVITFDYTCPVTNEMTSSSVTIFVAEAPVAALVDFYETTCSEPSGTFYFSNVFEPGSSQVGTWTKLSGPDDDDDNDTDPPPPPAINNDNNSYNYLVGGCYTFRFTATDVNGCGVTSTDDVSIFIRTEPVFSFVMQSAGANYSGGCLGDASSVLVSPLIEHNETNPIISGTLSVDGGGATTWNLGADLIDGPNPGTAANYEYCVTMQKSGTTSCFEENRQNGTADCQVTKCVTISVYDDGSGCTSACELNPVDVCEIDVDPRPTLSCSFFTFSVPFDVVEAVLTPPSSTVISCNQDFVDITYESKFLMIGGDAASGLQTKVEDLPGVSIICSVFDFCICIDLGFLGDIEFRPFGALYDALGCDKTIIEFILDLLSALLGGSDSGFTVVADTDGDGAFDYDVGSGPALQPQTDAMVPVNITGQGELTVRMVTAWPNGPAGVCGQATQPGQDLLTLLPIGAIPIVGPTIVAVLEAANCNVDLSWSNEQTVVYQVVNNQPPRFINCPTAGYTFSQDFSCDTEANWSIPIAIDDCSGEPIPFVDVVNGEAIPAQSTNGYMVKVMYDANGVETLIPAEDESPNPGDDLPIGIYSVTYRAFTCSGAPSAPDCIIPIIISAGDPELLAPDDVTVCNDIDECSAIVNGLAPLKGIGCNTIVTYYTTGETIMGTQANPINNGLTPGSVADVSGSMFELGTTTVHYILNWTDENGVVMTLTDEFDVTVEDCQNPIAECHSVSVQMNNVGMGTVTAEELAIFSSDNCPGPLNFAVRKGTAEVNPNDPNVGFAPEVMYSCGELGVNFVTLRVMDAAGNTNYCLATVTVVNYFDGFTLTMDAPELCLEANNPEQFDFTNYLNITLPNGTILNHNDVGGVLQGNVVGLFGITSFIPSDGYTGNMPPEIGDVMDPKDIGYIDPMTGMYTPGSGTGFVTISYVLTLGDQASQNNNALEGCYIVVHETFELKQPLILTDPATGMEWDPRCECLGVNSRQVVLGEVVGGLEPYRIEFDGGTLDWNQDDIPDDISGIYTYDNTDGHDINDARQDLGLMWLNYTSPIWSITVVDARGCEIARSGSCDIIDLTEGPNIDCMGVNDFDTEVYTCERQYEWFHAIPSDNCAVTLYSYTITNPDGTIAGPFILNSLIDDIDDGVPLEQLLEAEYEFELGTSTVAYYAEDAVGNFTTCSFDVIVEDNDPPYFINCPYPDVVVSTEFGHCDAYVNYSLPFAMDNCVVLPTVTQIDDTGLSTGDRFPIGTTILTYEAMDGVGNKAICKVKVVVNNYWNVPEIVCPDNVEATNDDWLCAGTVNNLTPEATELCQDDLIVSYQIETDGEVTLTGLTDASTSVSGHLFPVGVSTVTYRTQNQPLLLISEIAQDADNLYGGMNPPPIVNEFQCFADTLFKLGNGGTGEGLVFYPSDDLDSVLDDVIYHYSGDSDGDEYFEEIYFPGMCPQPNHASGDTYGPDAAGRIFGMVWVPDSTKFIAMDEFRNMFKVSTTGDFELLDNPFVGTEPLAGFVYTNDTYYGVDRTNTNLVEFDPATGMVVNTVAMVSLGDAIVAGIDIAMDPVSGDTYILYQAGGAGAYLGTLDLTNGVITELGDTGVDFDALTVDGTGQVYAMSSDDADETLYTIKCAIPGDDYIEITNFGPGDYDISCLDITRECPDGTNETFIVPEGTILAPGAVLTLHYGPGVDNTFGPNYFYNYCEGGDQDANSTCRYTLSYGNNVNIDAMTMFADATAGIIREDLFDTDTPADFVLAEDCLALTLDEYNPIYPDPFDNGSETSLQTEPMATAECAFEVTVIDAEAPMCMEIDDVTTYTSTDPILALEGECNQSIINIPEADDCILTEINVSIQGNITGSESISVYIISPAGDSLALYDASCTGNSGVNITFDDEAEDDAAAICNNWNGSFMPEGGMLMTFYTQKSAGDWTLFVEVDAGSGASFAIDSWSIEATCMMDWMMDDEEIPNMPGLCGSEFTWIHPYFVDNCTIGTIEVAYTSDDDIEVPEGGLLLENFGKGGYEVTEFFEVGTTLVTYTLTDAAGLQSTCSFNVTVLDVEDPVITFCPDDIIIQLDGGECRKVVFYEVLAEDNCEVASIIGVPPSGIFYEIGINPVTVTVTDASGNTSVCTFDIIILEHVPTTDALACNDNITLTLDQNCEAEMHADFVLEGDDYYCYENYCIEVHTLGGILHENTFDLSDVGQTFQVTITDCVNSFNSCWGYVTIEEKLIPEILCPPDTVIYCTIDPLAVDEDGKLRTGEMELLSCEEFYTTLFEDEVIDNGECNNPVETILRTFYLSDNDGHTVSCTQTITIEQFDFSQIEWPEDFVIDCEEAYLDPSLTHPDITGYPEIEGVIVNLADEICNLSHGYSDQELWICGSSYEILRTWIVRNRCFDVGTDNPITYTQVIEVLDRQPPKLEGCPEDLVISTGPWNCYADTELPIPALLYDGCSAASFTAKIFGGGYIDVIGDVDDGTLEINLTRLGRGTTSTVVYYIEDECGNINTCSFNVTAEDLTPPTVVIAENIIISLSGSGGLASAKLYAEDVDKGSHDNCSGYGIEIRRDEDACGIVGNTTYNNKIPEFCDPWYDDDDHDYGQSVKFCCEDLTEVDEDGTLYGIVKVWVRVWDDANEDGIYGSYNYIDNPGNDHDHCELLDNYNEAWIHVRVEDKAPISLICPPDITIPCSWDHNDLSITGEAVANSTCGSIIPEYIDWEDVHCGEGHVLREWRAPGNEDYICVQRITIEPEESDLAVICPIKADFDAISGNPEVIFFNPFQPNHITVDCSDFEFPEPWQSGGMCNLVGVSSQIDTFWFEENACFKAIKKWHYIDWCTNDEFECEFVVSLVDTEGPEIMCQDTCFAIDDYWDDDEDGVTCEMADDVEVSSMAMDSGDCGSEWIKWVVVVDYWNDGVIDEEYSSFLAHDDPNYLDETLTGDPVSVELDKDELGGEWAIHSVEWKAFDGCGNVTQCLQVVEVADKKAPTPYCVGISTALMDPEAGNLVEVWAKDFNQGSIDNCTAQDWLKYTFNEVPPVIELIDEDHCFVPVWEDRDNCIPMRDSEALLIISEEDNNCNDYEDGATRPDCALDGSQKWTPNAVDEDGKPCKTSGIKFIGDSWCGENEIRVSVWDNKLNMDFCWVTLIIHGSNCPDNPGLGDGNIAGILRSHSNNAAVDKVIVTNASEFIAGGIITMTTSGNGEYAFGNLILGGSYYITADKTDDYLNGVSTLDLLLMQYHVLGTQPLDTPYKVIAADVDKSDGVTAIDLIELRKLILGYYTELPSNSSWRFIDAKVSLDNFSPWPVPDYVLIDNLEQDMMEEHFTAVKVGDVNNTSSANAQDINTEVRSKNTLDIVVVSENNQLIFKAADDIDDLHGYQFTMKVDGKVSGVVAAQIRDMSSQNIGILDNNIVTCSYHSAEGIRIKKDQELFRLQGIKNANLIDGLVSSEAYTQTQQSKEIQISELRFVDESTNDLENKLYQNKPNPFSEETIIEFDLIQSGAATISFIDLSGKVVKVIEADYEAGNHQIRINKDDLQTSGVILYQIESGEFIDSKRMIILR